MQTYHLVKKLASDLGVKKVSVVANKVHFSEDEDFIRREIPAEALLGIIHYNDEVIKADREGVSPFDTGGKVLDEIRAIKSRIDAEMPVSGS